MNIIRSMYKCRLGKIQDPCVGRGDVKSRGPIVKLEEDSRIHVYGGEIFKPIFWFGLNIPGLFWKRGWEISWPIYRKGDMQSLM